MQNCRALGALPQTLVPPAAGGFAPRLPASGERGLRSQSSKGLPQMGAPPPDPQNSFPHCEFLATRLLTSANVKTWFEFDLQIKRAERAEQFKNFEWILNLSAFVISNGHKKRSKCDPNDVKVFFLKKMQKLPSNWGLCPQTPVCNTLELHQFAQHAA